MKKLLLIALLLITNLTYAQHRRDSVRIKTDIFEVVYSEVLEQPKWIQYYVECPDGTAPRSGLEFRSYPKVKTSDDSDYVNNVYDKGHMAPAADFACDRFTIAKTFTYINCALQHQDLNRGVWKNLEVFERNLASRGIKVKVTIKVDFTNAKKLPTGATVPTGFWKIIEADGKVYEFYFLNVTPTKSDFMLYQTNCCK